MKESETEKLDHAGLLWPFLASRFRSRYDDVRPGSARRFELYRKLCHRYDEVLDWRYARPTSGIALERELREIGAPTRCSCFCTPEEWHGREAPLAEAISALYGHGLPVLLVCRPGQLAYFEPEYVSGSGERYVLQRSSYSA